MNNKKENCSEESERTRKLTHPDGYEVDPSRSTFDCIVYVKRRETVWEDIGEIEGWHVSLSSGVHETEAEKGSTHNKNTWPTKELAEAALALSQLMQWRKKRLGTWDHRRYYEWIISKETKGITKAISDVEVSGIAHTLSFPTEGLRDAFFEEFRDLLETARPLL